MQELKLRIVQISGNSFEKKLSGSMMPGDPVANRILVVMGFGRDGKEHRLSDCGIYGEAAHLYGGARPIPGREFWVYYTGSGTEGGTFRLVSVEEGGHERDWDSGVATEAHIHGGLNTFTFYGKEGSLMPSWSFHCERPSAQLERELNIK
jgi:hypothetical protein